MATFLCSWLASLQAPGVPDVLDALRNLPWPEAVQRPARFVLDTLQAPFGAAEPTPPPPPASPPESPVAAFVDIVENRSGRFSSATRVAAVRALGEMLADDEDAVLVEATRDLDADVSLTAVVVLADRGGAAAEAALVAVAEDDSGFFLDSTRAAASEGLARIRRDDLL